MPTYSVSAARAGTDGPVAGLPAGLVLSEDGRSISGAVTEEEALGAYSLTLIATDDSGTRSKPYVFILKVVNVNDAPEGAIPTQTVGLGEAFEIDLSSFISDAEGDALSYAFTSPASLPLTLAPACSVLTGTSPAVAGEFEVTVTATDASGDASLFAFTIEAVPADEVPVSNQAPLVVSGNAAPPSSFEVMEGEAMTWDAMAWFTDPDLMAEGSGESLTYTRTLQKADGSPVTLPTWLVLNASTGVLTIAADATNDDQTLAGMAGESSLLGGAGDDTLEAHADTEVLYGDAGVDTLELDFNETLDLVDASVRGRVRGVEEVSLADADAAVRLNQAAVYALVEARDNGGTLTDVGEVLLRLEGSSGMVVLSDKSDWTEEQANAEGTADLWTHDSGSAKLLIDDGLLA